MVKIKSKITGKTVEQVSKELFRIDKDFIYSQDEFANEVKWDRIAFYAELEVNLSK
jgi:hypothetical protein